MSLVTLKDILAPAVEEKYAVGAFSGMDLWSAEACIAAAEEKKSPLILLCGAEVIREHGHNMELYTKYIMDLARASSVPVSPLLDHGANFEECMEFIRYGFPGVMFDGSSLSHEDNIEATKEIVKAAHAVGVSVEAEIGHVGGNEGTLDEGIAKKENYTKPEDAEMFVKATGVDALAVSIGTVHGIYQGTPKLDIGLLDEIRAAVGSLPLVMHGGSGLPDEQFTMAVEHGINKVNFVTYMMVNAVNKIITAREESAGKKFSLWNAEVTARKAIMEYTKKEIDIFRSAGRAQITQKEFIQ